MRSDTNAHRTFEGGLILNSGAVKRFVPAIPHYEHGWPKVHLLRICNNGYVTEEIELKARTIEYLRQTLPVAWRHLIHTLACTLYVCTSKLHRHFFLMM